MTRELERKLINLGLRKVHKSGQFTLHSGLKSSILWDIGELYKYSYWIRIEAIKEFIWEIGLNPTGLLIGIQKGGYLLAKDVGQCLGTQVLDNSYGCIQSRYSGECSRTIIIDDVLTTGNTVKKILEKNDRTTHIAILVNRSGKTEIDGIPIISGVVTDEVYQGG